MKSSLWQSPVKGRPSPKKSAVVFEQRQVKPFLKIEHTMYIFPT